MEIALFMGVMWFLRHKSRLLFFILVGLLIHSVETARAQNESPANNETGSESESNILDRIPLNPGNWTWIRNWRVLSTVDFVGTRAVVETISGHRSWNIEPDVAVTRAQQWVKTYEDYPALLVIREKALQNTKERVRILQAAYDKHKNRSDSKFVRFFSRLNHWGRIHEDAFPEVMTLDMPPMANFKAGDVTYDYEWGLVTLSFGRRSEIETTLNIAKKNQAKIVAIIERKKFEHAVMHWRLNWIARVMRRTILRQATDPIPEAPKATPVQETSYDPLFNPAPATPVQPTAPVEPEKSVRQQKMELKVKVESLMSSAEFESLKPSATEQEEIQAVADLGRKTEWSSASRAWEWIKWGRDKIDGMNDGFTKFFNKWVLLATRLGITYLLIKGAVNGVNSGMQWAFTKTVQQVTLTAEEKKAVEDQNMLYWYFSEIKGDTIQTQEEFKANFDSQYARRFFTDAAVDLLWDYLDGKRDNLDYDGKTKSLRGEILSPGQHNEAKQILQTLKHFWNGKPGVHGSQSVPPLRDKIGPRSQMAQKLNAIFDRAHKLGPNGLDLILEDPRKALELEKQLAEKARLEAEQQRQKDEEAAEKAREEEKKKAENIQAQKEALSTMFEGLRSFSYSRAKELVKSLNEMPKKAVDDAIIPPKEEVGPKGEVPQKISRTDQGSKVELASAACDTAVQALKAGVGR